MAVTTRQTRKQGAIEVEYLGDPAQQTFVMPIVQHILSRASGFNMSTHGRALRDGFEKHVINKEPVPKPNASTGIIDIGCGEGWLGNALCKWDSKIKHVGFDKEQRWQIQSPNYVKKDLTEGKGFPEDAIVAHLTQTTGLMVTAITVLDQLDEDQLKIGLTNTRAFLEVHQASAKGLIPLLVATLDPEFFVSPIGYLENQQLEITRPSFDTKPYFRSAEWYETRFENAGFTVLDCMPISWVRLRETEMQMLRTLPGSRDICASGPFIFWLLVARQSGEIAEANVISDLQNPALNEIRRLNSLPDVRVIKYREGERVICPGTLGGELMIVANGQFELDLAGDPRPFNKGEMIGELESGGNFVSSRFLFPVSAKEGQDEQCSLILVPNELAKTLLMESERNGALGVNRSSVTRYAYETLRDRFAKHNLLANRTADKGDLVFELKNILIQKHNLQSKVRKLLEHPQTAGRVRRAFLQGKKQGADASTEKLESWLVDKIMVKIWDDDPTIETPALDRLLDNVDAVIAHKPKKKNQLTASARRFRECLKRWSPYVHAANYARAILFALAEEHDRIKKQDKSREGDHLVCRNTGDLQRWAFPQVRKKRNTQKQLNLPPLRTLFKLGLIDFWDNASANKCRNFPGCEALIGEHLDRIQALNKRVFGSSRDYIILVRDLRGLFFLVAGPGRYLEMVWRELTREVKEKYNPSENDSLFSAHLQRLIAIQIRGLLPD